MEIEFCIDSKNMYDEAGLVIPLRVFADIPTPCAFVLVYNDITDQKLDWWTLDPADQKKINAEIEKRSEDYIESSERTAKKLFDISSDVSRESIAEFNRIRGLR